MKVAVCTTFNNSSWDVCAAEMLATFKQYWPEDIKIYIQIDEQPIESFDKINNDIVSILGEDRSFIAAMWDDDQKAFMERWKDHKPESYMFDVVKFSHKVFALEKCADAIKDEYDYLIWLDSDVITKQAVTYEWLKEVLPGPDEVCSYLGREGWYSECGWVAYNLKSEGHKLLTAMKARYASDSFKSWNEGWTDCHIFDFCRKVPESWESTNVVINLPPAPVKGKNLSPFYKHGESQIDVWPQTKLAECLVHRKGKRKHMAAEQRTKPKSAVIDASDIKIKTRNCLDAKKICENVNKNLSQIRAWATLTQPGPEDIVFCSAGPSLANHIEEIRQRQKDGALVVAVKHAIETLAAHGIKPWGVVLLDPRAHVEEFVKAPDPDAVYFVASMCDPSVVKTLNDNKCKVIGYHALVGAGEQGLMIPSDLPISGGSATSTRGLALFADMFGYRNFHLYGYDLCHWQKPDMTQKSDEGQPKYMEISIGATGHKGKYFTRTFWTEGQFLAQSNELQKLWTERKDITLVLHGEGMPAWLQKHYLALKKYQSEYNERLNEKRRGSPTLESYVSGISRGSELSRG
jgi:hypothetical protein